MIALGCDHAGYTLKMEIIHHLNELNIPIEDLGCNDTQSVDHVEYARLVSEAVRTGQCERGILVCGTGIGMCIAANKTPGIRAALCHDVFSAKATRQHNNSNVLTLGARVIGAGLALEIVDTWLNTAFLGGKYQARVEHVSALERFYYTKE